MNIALNEACELIVDCPHSTEPDEGQGYPIIRTPNIGKGYLNLEGVQRVSKEAYDRRNKRAIPQPNDLILAREAPAGNVAIIPEGLEVCLGQRTVLIRPNKNVVNPLFLNYYLNAPEQRHHLLRNSNGATVSHVNMPIIRNLPLVLPTMGTQKRIASILSAYDELIENNRKQIKLLEEAAQRLYKEWFIDFKFPGHETTPIDPETNLPEGWKRGTVSELFQIVNGFAFKSETFVERGSYSIVTIKNVKDGQFDSLGMATIDELPERMPCDCILHRGDILLSLTGNVGRTCIITAKDCLLNQRVGKVVSNYPTYSYCFLRNSRQQSRMVTLANGTAQLNLSPVRFCEDFTIVPSGYLLEEFEQVTHLLITEIIFLSEQVTHLQEARDRLLPKLMSGEIEVN